MPNAIYCRDGHYIGVVPERIHGGFFPGRLRDMMEERFVEELMNLSHCKRCGKEVITECLHCQAPIEEDDFGGSRPAYCSACGRPFPWTENDQKNDDGEPDFFGPIEK